MTVIAAFRVATIPLVMGDLLLTSHIAPKEGVSLPALGDVSDFYGGHFSVAGLQQKVVVIHDNCVLAWAGSWVSARVAISELREIFRTNSLSAEDVLRFLQAHPDVRKHGNQFVGYANHGGVISRFRYQTLLTETAYFGDIACGGSGAFAVKEFSDTEINSTFFSGGGNNFNLAFCQGLIFGGIMLRAEFHGGDAAVTLQNFFGGGFEIAGFSWGRFAKIADITFFVHSAELQGEDITFSAFPGLIVKQSYFGSYLGIRSLRFKFTPDGVIDSLDEQHHIVPPMYEEPRPADLENHLKNIAFESRWNVHCVHVKGKGLLNFVETVDLDSLPKVTVKRSNGITEFRMQKEFLKDIADQVRRMSGVMG